MKQSKHSLADGASRQLINISHLGSRVNITNYLIQKVLVGLFNTGSSISIQWHSCNSPNINIVPINYRNTIHFAEKFNVTTTLGEVRVMDCKMPGLGRFKSLVLRLITFWLSSTSMHMKLIGCIETGMFRKLKLSNLPNSLSNSRSTSVSSSTYQRQQWGELSNKSQH